MRYMGSKNRLAKELLPIILKDRRPGQWYVEPFVGGANLIDKVSGNRIGSDVNPYLIALLRALQKGWIPPDEVSEGLYKEVKNNRDKYPKELVAFVGFCCSYASRFFEGYARSKDKDGILRGHALENKINLMKQAPNLKGINFYCGQYYGLVLPKQSIIYCDPPYAGTKKYSSAIKPDHFWSWCTEKAKEGHKVFISEYKAPEGFECIWEKQIRNSISNQKTSSVERLFIPK